MPSPESAKFWIKRGRLLCWKHNAAVFLEAWLAVLLVASALVSCAALFLRRQGMETPLIWPVWGTIVALGGCIVFWLRRKDFFQLSDAWVRLEVQHALDTRLTSASLGVGRWPAPVGVATDGWHWRWTRVAWPMLAALGLVWAATAMPLPGLDQKLAIPQTVPVAWTEVAEWVETLREQDIVQPASLESIRQQLDSLRQQNPEAWYDHSSLEAGDSLRAETGQAIYDLQNQLEAAAAQAAKLIATSDQGISQRELQSLNEALAGTLQNLSSGRLPLNEEMLKQIRAMDPKALKSLSAGNLAELKKRLEKASGACQSCLGGEAQFAGLGAAKGAGQGGLGGGGDPAPLTGGDPVNLYTKSIEALEAGDLSRAMPGEVLALSSGEHEVDQASLAVTPGGAFASPGKGGEAVWRDSLTPQERETAARFFQ